MTVKQKKSIRAGVLTAMMVLLAIGTFDSRQSYLVAQAESGGSVSTGNVEFRNADDNRVTERLTAVQAPLKTVVIEDIVETETVVEKKIEVEVETVAKVKEDVQEPVKAKPAPVLRESPRDERDDSPFVKKGGPELKPDPDLEPDPDQEPDSGNETGPRVAGDKNKGHGNDEDGYDEDNPGQGSSRCLGSFKGRKSHRGSKSVRSSKRRSGKRASSSRRARGKSRGRGGSKKR